MSVNALRFRLAAGRRRKPAWPSWVTEGVLASASLLLLLAGALSAGAHGEVHLRLLALTREIQTATNNPARVYLERGELERQHGLQSEAASDYEQAAKLDPDLPGIDLCRGRLMADRGQLEAARAVFDRALQRNAHDGECYIGRGRVLLKLNQRDAAVGDYWRGLAELRDPKPEYVLELAQVLKEEGKTSEALRALDAGIATLGPILPLQGYALDLELSRKNNDAALVRLETMLARAMRKENWFARRGDIQFEAGKVIEARGSYEAALASVNKLPPRLQQSPAVVKLLAHINARLAGLANGPAAAKK